MSITTIIIIGALILMIFGLIFFIHGKKKMVGTTNQITITMPSMKELEAREVARDDAPEKY
jgi:hypothetical protein